MIRLITSQEEIETLINSIDWHQSYLKEMHFADSQHQDASGRVNCGVATLARLVVVLPAESEAIEFVCFETESCQIFPRFELDEGQKASIKRRSTELEFGAFSVKCACVGYRKLEIEEIQDPQFFTKEVLFDHNLEPATPYNLDWRTALDLAGSQKNK